MKKGVDFNLPFVYTETMKNKNKFVLMFWTPILLLCAIFLGFILLFVNIIGCDIFCKYARTEHWKEYKTDFMFLLREIRKMWLESTWFGKVSLK